MLIFRPMVVIRVPRSRVPSSLDGPSGRLASLARSLVTASDSGVRCHQSLTARLGQGLSSNAERPRGALTKYFELFKTIARFYRLFLWQ